MKDSHLRGSLPRTPTARQVDVLAAFVAAGGSVPEAAARVGIRPSTAKRHLADLRKRYGDRLAVVAVAIESDEADVRRIATSVGGSLRFAMGTPEVARAFGDVTAVPTLFLFDAKGATAAAFYGAPPTLHADAEARIEKILQD